MLISSLGFTQSSCLFKNKIVRFFKKAHTTHAMYLLRSKFQFSTVNRVTMNYRMATKRKLRKVQSNVNKGRVTTKRKTRQMKISAKTSKDDEIEIRTNSDSEVEVLQGPQRQLRRSTRNKGVQPTQAVPCLSLTSTSSDESDSSPDEHVAIKRPISERSRRSPSITSLRCGGDTSFESSESLVANSRSFNLNHTVNKSTQTRNLIKPRARVPFPTLNRQTKENSIPTFLVVDDQIPETRQQSTESNTSSDLNIPPLSPPTFSAEISQGIIRPQPLLVVDKTLGNPAFQMVAESISKSTTNPQTGLQMFLVVWRDQNFKPSWVDAEYLKNYGKELVYKFYEDQLLSSPPSE